MRQAGMLVQQLPSGGKRGGDQPEGSPFANMTLGKGDIRNIGKTRPERLKRSGANTLVNMDHHRRATFGPEARNLGGAVKGGVAQHDDPDAHAQFPLDMRPRISSWRQLMYFSDHLVHRSTLSGSRAA